MKNNLRKRNKRIRKVHFFCASYLHTARSLRQLPVQGCGERRQMGKELGSGEVPLGYDLLRTPCSRLLINPYCSIPCSQLSVT